MKMRKVFRATIALSFVILSETVVALDYPIRAAKMTDVKVTSGFWFDRIVTNRIATLKACIEKCKETSRIANFTNAANRVGIFGGIPFDDSDVYKVVEGAAYVLALNPDPELESYCDWLIGVFARAQEPDGYLYTARTLGHYFTGAKGDWTRALMGPVRWSNVDVSHELYNNGHMIEAACAWYSVTGKHTFLKVACNAADLIDRVFGPGPTQLKNAPGHEEIELALAKLYRVTGEERYLKLARHFIDVRGRNARIVNGVPAGASGEPIAACGAPGSNLQMHMPPVLQREAVGHAVRAGYLYCGMVDVAALTGDRAYLNAVMALWENVVSRKLHLTGGIGGTPKGEAFEREYVLENDLKSTYLETCAAIANAFWNQRLFCWRGETKYVDILERTLYNGFLSGISLTGEEFFYPNPLASKGGYKRSKWFECSCCPVNDVRFIPQVPSFAYAVDDGGTIYWNLFMEGEATVGDVKMICKTAYPWDGKATLEFVSIGPQPLTLKVRIPGWAKGQPVPSDLYVQAKPSSEKEITVLVNGNTVNSVSGGDGYLSLKRGWRPGDSVELNLPMPVKRVRAHEKVEADKGRLAVEKGPIVYCAEGVDNGDRAYEAVLPGDATFCDDTITIGDKVFPALRASNGLKLVPYCLWGNRKPGNEMQVWFKER